MDSSWISSVTMTFQIQYGLQIKCYYILNSQKQVKFYKTRFSRPGHILWFNCVCYTLIPQIKGKCHCIHWYKCVYLVKKLYNSLNCLMARWNHCAVYIATTNPILILDFNFKVEVYHKGSLKSINSHKNLATKE